MKHDLREPITLTTLLLLYSNGLAYRSYKRGEYPEQTFRRINPLLILVMLVYAAKREGDLGAVGLHTERLASSALGGLGVGAALSVIPLIFFKKPILLDTPLEYGPITSMTRRELLEDVLLRVPVSIALTEELAFRGLLYSSLRRHFSAKTAIIASAAAFAGWHFTVTITSATQTNMRSAVRLPRLLQPFILPIAVLGGMISTGLAGAAFGLLREKSGNLVGPVIAHWLVDGLMIAALWRAKRET